MKPDGRKNRALRQQYPFVDKLLSEKYVLEPYGAPEQNRVDDLSITVQRADGDLLFRRADNIGLGDHAFLAEVTRRRRNQLGRRGEAIFAIGDHGQILNQLRWPRNPDDHPKVVADPKHGQFAREVFNGGHRRYVAETGSMPWVDSYLEETHCLVWVTVETWHLKTGKHDQPGDQFGELQERTMAITIYLAPREGFLALATRARLEDHLQLNTRVLCTAALNKNMEEWRLGGNLDELVFWFAELAYLRGIRQFLNTHLWGTTLHCGPVRLLAKQGNNNHRMILLCGGDWLHLKRDLTNPDHDLRVLDFKGTIPRLRAMVLQAANTMASNPTLTVDASITF